MRLLGISLFCLCISSVLTAQVKSKKVVFIIADGIPADVMEKSPTPVLKKIAAEGAYTRAHVGGDRGTYSETPTISAVGYNSLLTGTWVNKHNVWDNDIKAPNYHYWTLFRFYKQQHPSGKIGIFSTWTDNRTKLAGESLPQTGKLKFDYVSDGYELDTVHYPHDRESNYIHLIDERVADEAARCIHTDAPDLSWVYLEYTDDIGHQFGDGDHMEQAIAYLDNQVGRIWDAIQYRKQHFSEEWLLLITTDHGRDSVKGRNHGGQSERERTTWIITNANDCNDYFHMYQPGIVDLMPTITGYMGCKIPTDQLREIDGVSLLDDISIAKPAASLENGMVKVSWKALDPRGKVKIWLTTTNRFKEGGVDDYRLIREVATEQESYTFSVRDTPSPFYKIVLEGPRNSLNRWIVVGSQH
ncbi:MAG TPA: alkaline phosphatase family protein [Puia sp.]|nr:alkaline phosphatase family protein [Puia sp.]